MKEMRITVRVRPVEMSTSESRRLWALVFMRIVVVVSFGCAFGDQEDAYMKS